MESPAEREVYPLNSKRINLAQLRQLAQALDLPVTGSSGDLQIMVEGKLREVERDPMNVQLVVKENTDGSQCLELQDESGPFLETTITDGSKASTPAETHGSCLSLAGSQGSVIEQSTEPVLVDENPHRAQGSLEDANTEICTLRQWVEEQKLIIQESKQLLFDTGEKTAELSVANQELKGLLGDAEERLAKLVVENRRLTEQLTQQQLTACSDLENLKQELQQGQTRIKELWKKNCDQVREFDLIIWARERELASLRKQLEAGGVTVTLPLTGQSIGMSGANIGEPLSATTNPQGAALSQSITAFPVVTSCPTLATTPLSRQATTSLQLPGMLGGQSLSQILREPRESAQVTTPFVLPTVSCHAGIPSMSLTDQVGTVTSVWTPQTVSYSARPVLQNNPSGTNPTVVRVAPPVPLTEPPVQRRGKAPPIDSFTGEDSEIRFDDWIPTLERAATWNNWTEDETLMQLAGYLRGRALQEWNLITPADRRTYQSAIVSLRTRLDPGNKTLAALDFRHITQKDTESVSDFIRRLERTFQIAFGHDLMSTETRDVLLYGKLQDGLRIDLVSKAPAISGAQSYQELCIAARNEERRLAELKRKKQYAKGEGSQQTDKTSHQQQTPRFKKDDQKEKSTLRRQTRCYICDSPNHLARECRAPKTESRGKTRVVRARTKFDRQCSNFAEVTESLFPSATPSQAPTSSIQSTPTTPKCVEVQIECVPVRGIIDTGSDITILSGTVFREIVTMCNLEKKHFKPADRRAYTYGSHPLSLDGQMDLHIKFGEKCICETVYVKLDASDALLLSEHVCCELNIVSYHPDVHPVPELDRKKSKGKKGKKVKIKLIQTVRLPAVSSAVVQVKVKELTGTHLMLELDKSWHDILRVSDCLLKSNDGDTAPIIVSNTSLSTQVLKKGTYLGKAATVNLIHADTKEDDNATTEGSGDDLPVGEVLTYSNERICWRKQELRKQLQCSSNTELLSTEEKNRLFGTLEQYHDTFSLEDGERGETNLVEFSIDTGESAPIKQAARRVPFSARQEIVAQLDKMKEEQVIHPSKSSWASPVVLVRKRDGSLRFCVDYRALNSVTKPDVFPLPRIDDLLDKLGHSKYFTTLDLKSGYWQIKMDVTSQEKTAFVTHRGLYEFRVMPFGVKNAPAVFQRLMQNVLMDLRTDDEQEFVDVYLDDIIIFSKTLEEHINHLLKVLECFRKANLKLNPQKCRFCCSEVEYLGHIVTPNGFKPNVRNVEAVKKFPVPTTLKELRQFLGLTSHYRRFVKGFAMIAQPLYALTKKDVPFYWTAECESAFDYLKVCLITMPVLAYPDFDKNFVLETDASILGLGAILSQVQEDGKLHPIAYASRSLSKSEKNYSVTDLETLAVVWGITHFRYYLYGHQVSIYTDHAAVKAVLGTPNLSGKHARWWNKVHGSGISEIDIVHRAGRENRHADALSRQPILPAPAEEDSELEVQVAKIASAQVPDTLMISELLGQQPMNDITDSDTLSSRQLADPDLCPIIHYLKEGKLPEDSQKAQEVVTLAQQFTILDGMLYRMNPKQGELPQIAVPASLKQQVMEEHHAGVLAGHFSGPRLFKIISRRWWWKHMYKELMDYARNCPQCTIVGRSQQKQVPPLAPIPVDHPFQIIGVDIMELPLTTKGNRYLIVFQDLFTKWPMAFPTPDQKAKRIARLLAEEIVPLFGVPEALLSDRGTNLLSILMQDVCKLLGIKKLNTTAHHPQCDGMIERLNRTFKSMLRKQAVKFGAEWDTYLPGALWAYRNTPHSSTDEKPSYLLFGYDCRSPTEATLLPATLHQPVDINDYREELVVMLSSARQMAAKANQEAQRRYKHQYDKSSTIIKYRIGDWVFVYFPSEETGKMRKLSRPWHGPYRIISRNDPDVTVTKVYFPDDPPLQVHQLRVKNCPMSFPCGYYWYGSKRPRPGRPPKWVEKFMNQPPAVSETNSSDKAYLQGRNKQKKPSQASEKTDNLLPTESDSDQSGGQPRSPYNLRYRRQGTNRNISSGSSSVSEGMCNRMIHAACD